MTKEFKLGQIVKFQDKYGEFHVGTIEEIDGTKLPNGKPYKSLSIRTYDEFIGRKILVVVGYNQVKSIIK